MPVEPQGPTVETPESRAKQLAILTAIHAQLSQDSQLFYNYSSWYGTQQFASQQRRMSSVSPVVLPERIIRFYGLREQQQDPTATIADIGFISGFSHVVNIVFPHIINAFKPDNEAIPPIPQDWTWERTPEAKKQQILAQREAQRIAYARIRTEVLASPLGLVNILERYIQENLPSHSIDRYAAERAIAGIKKLYAAQTYLHVIPQEEV